MAARHQLKSRHLLSYRWAYAWLTSSNINQNGEKKREKIDNNNKKPNCHYCRIYKQWRKCRIARFLFPQTLPVCVCVCLSFCFASLSLRAPFLMVNLRVGSILAGATFDCHVARRQHPNCRVEDSRNGVTGTADADAVAEDDDAATAASARPQNNHLNKSQPSSRPCNPRTWILWYSICLNKQYSFISGAGGRETERRGRNNQVGRGGGI